MYCCSKELFNHAIEGGATVERVLDVAESNSFTFPVNRDTIGIDTILFNHEAFNLFSTLFGEFHVVFVRSSVVAETNNGDFNIGVVFHDARNGLHFNHFGRAYVPIIVSIENRERNSVVVKLVGLQFVENTIQAVGNALSASQSFLSDFVVFVAKILNLISEFLLIVFCVFKFFLDLVVFVGESIESLFGDECTLGNQLLVGSGDAKVEDVTNGSKEIGVVESSLFVPETRSISDDVSFYFCKEEMAIAHSVAETETSVELATNFIHTASFVVAESQTGTAKEVDVGTTFGVPVMETVVQRQQEINSKSTVLIH